MLTCVTLIIYIYCAVIERKLRLSYYTWECPFRWSQNVIYSIPASCFYPIYKPRVQKRSFCAIQSRPNIIFCGGPFVRHFQFPRLDQIDIWWINCAMLELIRQIAQCSWLHTQRTPVRSLCTMVHDKSLFSSWIKLCSDSIDPKSSKFDAIWKRHRSDRTFFSGRSILKSN